MRALFAIAVAIACAACGDNLAPPSSDAGDAGAPDALATCADLGCVVTACRNASGICACEGVACTEHLPSCTELGCDMPACDAGVCTCAARHCEGPGL